ncbi:MAG: hypothetical protein HZB53_15720 [Chloroflexi bacterium]|nr:hypothetical protein [Chloroflexota bacterium]
MINQFVDLRIVPTDHLHLHEEVEPARVRRVTERIAAEQMLKNPVIVAELDDYGHFVVLDGANRSTALADLGVRDTLVQVVDYGDPGVRLDTWYHLVADIDKHDLFARIGNVTEVRLKASGLLAARALLVTHQILAYMVCKDGDVHQVLGPADLPGRARMLTDIARTYKAAATIYRVQTDDIPALLPMYPNVAAVIAYPLFRPADILEMARSRARLPTGITRHVIARRALRVNVPLAELGADRPLADKNRDLQERITAMLKAGQVRHYEESTYLFDE